MLIARKWEYFVFLLDKRVFFASRKLMHFLCWANNCQKFVGPRARRPKKTTDKTANDEKRPRTAFSGPQLARLKVSLAKNCISPQD